MWLYYLQFFFIITFYSFLIGDIHVFNRRTNTESEIKTIEIGKTLLISAKDFSSSLSSKIYENAERKKLVLYLAGCKIKVSGYSSFIIIDEKIQGIVLILSSLVCPSLVVDN